MESEQTMENQVTGAEKRGNTSSSALAAVIDGLDVSPRKKELFHLIYKYDLLEFKGMVSTKKAKEAGISFKDRFGMCTSILGFIFSFLYYFATGMWRKGLVIFGLSLAIGAVFVAFEYKSTFLGFLPSGLAMLMAFGDQYRTKVLKETFWF